MTGDVDIQANILINSKCHACLAGLGLATNIEDTTSVEGPSGCEAESTIRWTAPEVLFPDMYGYAEGSQRGLPSKSTDIYALGMTTLEVRTSLPLSITETEIAPECWFRGVLLSCSLIFPVGGDRLPTFRTYRPGGCGYTKSPEWNPTRPTHSWVLRSVVGIVERDVA